MEEAAGDATIDKAQVRVGPCRARRPPRALGASSFAALKALLPFSRNDYWEVAELRQRIGRTR